MGVSFPKAACGSNEHKHTAACRDSHGGNAHANPQPTGSVATAQPLPRTLSRCSNDSQLSSDLTLLSHGGRPVQPMHKLPAIHNEALETRNQEWRPSVSLDPQAVGDVAGACGGATGGAPGTQGDSDSLFSLQSADSTPSASNLDLMVHGPKAFPFLRATAGCATPPSLTPVSPNTVAEPTPPTTTPARRFILPAQPPVLAPVPDRAVTERLLAETLLSTSFDGRVVSATEPPVHFAEKLRRQLADARIPCIGELPGRPVCTSEESAAPLPLASDVMPPASDPTVELQRSEIVQRVEQHLSDIKRVRSSVTPRYFRGLQQKSNSCPRLVGSPATSDSSSSQRHTFPSSSRVSSVSFSPYERHELECEDGSASFGKESEPVPELRWSRDRVGVQPLETSVSSAAGSSTAPRADSKAPPLTTALAADPLWGGGRVPRSLCPLASSSHSSESSSSASLSHGDLPFVRSSYTPPGDATSTPTSSLITASAQRNSILIRRCTDAGTHCTPSRPVNTATRSASDLFAGRHTAEEGPRMSSSAPQLTPLIPSTHRVSIVVNVPPTTGTSSLTSGSACNSLAVRRNTEPLDDDPLRVAVDDGPSVDVRDSPLRLGPLHRPDALTKVGDCAVMSPQLSLGVETEDNDLTWTESSGSPSTTLGHSLLLAPLGSRAFGKPFDDADLALWRASDVPFTAVSAPCTPSGKGESWRVDRGAFALSSPGPRSALQPSPPARAGSGAMFKEIIAASAPHKSQLAKRAADDYLLFTQLHTVPSTVETDETLNDPVAYTEGTRLP